MSPEYRYRQIDECLLEEMEELVLLGRSGVLLAPRYMGKSYVLRRLAGRLRNDRALIVASVQFARQPALANTREIQLLVHDSLRSAAPDVQSIQANSAEQLKEVRRLCDARPRQVVLLASDIDSLAHYQAHQFLREIRVLVENNGLVAVLSGGENLRDLVHGDDSEFNSAVYFLLQGSSETEFISYLGRRGEAAQIRFEDADTVLRHLYQQTGGWTHLARAVFWALLENKARELEFTPSVNNRALTLQEFCDFL